MSVPLTAFARPFLVAKDMRAPLASPVLIWDASSGSPGPPEPTALTSVGHAAVHQVGRDPLVFEVKKEQRHLNAFALGVTLGRTDNNDIIIHHESVSRFQGYFQQDLKTRRWSFTDANSTNGTFVGPLRLTPSRAHLLGDSDKMRVGNVDLLFFTPDAFIAYLKERLGG